MRLKQNIIFDNKFSDIQKKCSEICKAYSKTGSFLYRASNHIFNDFAQIYPRKDRKTLNMDSKLSIRYDEEFYKLFGWKPRSEAMFCTSDLTEIDIYGDHMYIVFPKNGFSFLWSPDIMDLYSSAIENKDNRSTYDIHPATLKWKLTDINPEELVELGMTKEQYEQSVIDDWHKEVEKQIKRVPLLYKNTNLPAAIRSGNEVSIKCDYYYVIDNNSQDDVERMLNI